eukprot:TRINITY_DN12574_c0_g1_i11.p2 TRINITY_DN12574_c0_g1~~TRINITY_DN12574_c0_g1_i11.p2  ORF type:complete len:251 (+),score=87.89 TRINITY_DN12574_c0_g1_i11:279-1031(+)
MITSLSVVLLHEMEKYNNLLDLMETSLTNLQKAVTGEVVMSQELDGIYTCFLMLKVPPTWKIYDSLKSLGSWYADLNSRVQFVRRWLCTGVPSAFRLSAFVFPQGFLTGALQSHARLYQIPIDQLSFDFEVTSFEMEEQVKELPKNGIYISGLYVEGAMWDQSRRALTDLPPGQLYKPMNVINFIPTNAAKEIEEGTYLCPVYKTAERQGVLTTTGLSSNFILAVELPCAGDKPDTVSYTHLTLPTICSV